MIGSHYYELLKCSPASSLAELKAAYHRAAKSSHPDLFPEEDRKRHEMRMMQINEAYMAILCDHAERSPHGAREQPAPAEAAGGQPTAPIASESRELGHLRDPAYTYYKLGFRFFSEGRRTLAKQYLSRGQRIDFSVDNVNVLRLAVASLHYFHRAYACFERVSSDYPRSVWARDSRMKIYYLNRYNAIYQRICDNLSKQISAIRAVRQSAET